MTERILVPKMPSFTARVKQRVERRHRLHQADTVVLGLEPLVDLQKGNDAPFLPQESRNRLFPAPARPSCLRKGSSR